MSNKTNKSLITAITAAVANALASVLGDSAPKTSARVSSQVDPPAEMAVRGKKGQVEDITIELTPAMIEGRMKLPSRMFTKGGKVVVDGHTITQQPHDQNRSTKFNPEIFGYDLSAGDTITFSHIGGREWEVSEVAEGRPSRKGKKTAAKPVAKPARKAVPAKKTAVKPTPKAVKAKGRKGADSDIDAKIEEFAALVIENAADEDFECNENIKQTGSFDLDARVLLTTAESQRFRSWRKRFNRENPSNRLSLENAVLMLNAAVEDDVDLESFCE